MIKTRIETLVFFKKQMFHTKWWSVFLNTFYPLRKELFDEMKQFCKSKELHGSILDVGCGSKPYKDLFEACDEYVGIDVAQTGHDHTFSQVDVTFDGIQIPFGDETFDTIICTEVLEHCIDPYGLISEMHRVLKKDGCCIISVPFLWPEHEIPYDFRRYNSYGIRQIFDGKKFSIIYHKKLVLGLSSILILFSFSALNLLPNKFKVARTLLSLVIAIPINLWYTITKSFQTKANASYSGTFTVLKKSNS